MIGRYLAIALAALSLVVSPGTSLASQRSEADRIWQAYEDHWQGVNTFSATFHQTIEVAGIGGVVTSSGRLYFEKPDKLRWNYEEGNPQSVVGDGKFIWIHQPDLSQVYRVDYRSAFGTGGLVTLLAGREGLAERYGFELLDSSAAGSVRLRLTPREGAGETLEIVMRDNDFALERVVVTDPAGSTTHLAFSNIRHNDKLAEDLFVFTPPDGIDIITDPVRSP